MFGSPILRCSVLALVSLVPLLLTARGTVGQTSSRFSDFFSSVNLMELENDIVLTDKLLENLKSLQTAGQADDVPFNLHENMAYTGNILMSAGDFPMKVSPTLLSTNALAARQESLKKILFKHPFKFIKLLFSDLDQQRSETTSSDERVSIDLTAYIGLKLIFNYVLKIFGANSKIGEFILSVSDSLRTLDGVDGPYSAHNNPFEWIGVQSPPSSLVITKKNEFGDVSEVEAKVTRGIIRLMEAVSMNRPHQNPKEKLTEVLLHMEYIVSVVKEFLWTLKHKIFPAELIYLNYAPKEAVYFHDHNHQSAEYGSPSPKLDGTSQYPEFYKGLLLGQAPTHVRTISDSQEFQEKYFPASAVYKSVSKRQANDDVRVETSQNDGNQKFGILSLNQLFISPLNDTNELKPKEKWNLLRKLFDGKYFLESQNNYYNYFVDEGYLADRTKRLITLLQAKETDSSSTDQKALVFTKRAISNLEKLLTDIASVRKAAIDSDPEGARGFGEVYYNAETVLDEIVEVSEAKSGTKMPNSLLDSFSGKILQKVFALSPSNTAADAMEQENVIELSVEAEA